MAENTQDSIKKNPAPERRKVTPDDEVESARILLREGLIEEAKKTLFRVLTLHPHYPSVTKLLNQIEELELKALFQPSRRSVERPVKFEDPDAIAMKLEADLSLEPEFNLGEQERWRTPANLGPQEQMDLAIAFYEMGCFADALRELSALEKKIRIENTFLGQAGVAVVALMAQSLVNLGREFEAKIKLEPILLETDLRHEDKLTLYYCMGLCEQALGNAMAALSWYQRVSVSDPHFRDITVRIKMMK